MLAFDRPEMLEEGSYMDARLKLSPTPEGVARSQEPDLNPSRRLLSKARSYLHGIGQNS